MNLKCPLDSEIKAKACEWVVELSDPYPDPEGEYPDPFARYQAFIEWFLSSERHRDAFVEAVVTSDRLYDIDPYHLIDIDAMLTGPYYTVVSPKSARAAQEEGAGDAGGARH